MKTQLECMLLGIVLLFPSANSQRSQPRAQSLELHTDIPAGPVSGVWSVAGSPYRINGEITVPDDSTLRIEPGVEVVFMGHYKLNVQGRLLSVGAEGDSIRFKAGDTRIGWHGIRFMGTPSTNDTSKLLYCVLRNGRANTGTGFDRCGGAMVISEFDKVLVSHCLFDSNMQVRQSGSLDFPEAGPAIYIYHASPTISHSTFSHHTGSLGSAILCLACPKAILSNNVFTGNRGQGGPVAVRERGSSIVSGNIITNNISSLVAGGIIVEEHASPVIENNVIANNSAPYAGGIFCWTGAKPVLLNNTIAFNHASVGGGGISCLEDCDPIFINNILFGNTAPDGAQVYLNDAQSDPVFFYCDIEGGMEGFGGVGAGANYGGRYENNISANPMFTNAASNEYKLSDSSLCIGVGVDSVEIAAVWYHVPSRCMGGTARPSPAGTKPDIGAYESLLGSPLVGVAPELIYPTIYALHQNYPNPFNPSTTITYELPKSTEVRVSVYDMLGREVSVLVDERKDVGVYEVKFDGSNLASGVYVYRIQAGDFTQSKRLLLLK